MTAESTRARAGLSPEVLTVLAVSALGVAAFLWLGLLQWPGAPTRCLTDIDCYCESPRAGFVRQPVNTWSNLLLLPLAWLVARDAGRLRRGQRPFLEPRVPTAPPRSRSAIARLGLLFALVLVAQGLGALFFHAALTIWSAVLDAVSVVVIGGLLLFTSLARAGWLRLVWIPVCLIALAVAAVLYRLMLSPVTAPIMLPVAIGIVISEVRQSRIRCVPSRLPWLRIAMIVFWSGVAIWTLSIAPGAPFCRGDSWLQGHALWHLTSGLAVAFFWLHSRDDLLALDAQPGQAPASEFGHHG